MKKIDPIIFGIIVLTILAFVGIIIASLSSAQPQALSYNIADQDRPKLKISEKKFDFGNMKVSDEKTKEITIKNAGTKPLAINNLSSSCSCTFVQVVIGGEKSPKFNMRSNSNWQKEIQPNQIATLIISYRPSIMPVQGATSRTVYFKTNDPENLEVIIEFTVFVE